MTDTSEVPSREATTSTDPVGTARRPTALRATDVSRSFGDVAVLDGVSLTVDRGDLVAVVGPNGSGKSTLMEILAGVHGADSGTVTTTRTETERSRDVGYLPQQPGFREGFSARDTLQFYARFLGNASSAEVDRTLERVGLADVADRNVGSLSGGMTRLLGLGQAIIGQPAVLVLDEPESGLDPAMVERLFRVLRSLADDGTGVVVASHHLSAVEMHADIVALLDRGQFAAVDTPANVLTSTDSETLVDAFLTTVREDELGSTVQSGYGTEVSDR
ncbi:ABC transporter ATP-binding protein [Haladaptatus sp. NG-WS-4]